MIRDITPTEANALLTDESGYVYLDVRTTAEYEAGHPVGARNIAVLVVDKSSGQMAPNETFLAAVQAGLPLDAKVIVGCKAGGRSMRAARIMEAAGYENVCNMVGGFGGKITPDGQVVEPGWAGLGLPVERGAEVNSK